MVRARLAGGLTTALLSYLLDQTGLTGTDRLLGGLFGLGRGAVLAAILVIALQFTGFDQDPWWAESKLIPYTDPIAEALKVLAEEGIEMLDEPETPVSPTTSPERRSPNG